MGALNGATRRELDELVAGDADWWPSLCGAVAEGGREALVRERNQRGWSWGALRQWIRSDDTRLAEYTSALEAYAEDMALETVGIADAADAVNAPVAKLKIDTRMKMAARLDRARWGDKLEVAVTDVRVEIIRFAPEQIASVPVPALEHEPVSHPNALPTSLEAAT